MRKLVSALLVAGLALPASAAASDKQLTHDTSISNVYALGSTVVYDRTSHRKHLKRGWMAVIGGKRRQLKRIPRNAYISDLGRDSRGRLVATFEVPIPHSKIQRARWYVYDLKRQRARLVRGLPGAGCRVDDLGVYGRRTAWLSICFNGKKDGAFLRTGKHTRRLGDTEYGSIVLRGASLAGIADDTGNGDFAVHRLVSRGHVCPKDIRHSFGAGDSEWFPLRAFIAGSRIAWVMGSYQAVLGAKIGGPCGPVGETGIYDFKPETSEVVSLAIDGNRLVYTDGSRILVHKLGTPSTAKPPNDDFEDATDLGGAAPQSVTGRTAHATVQDGEPRLRADETRTVWYRWTAPADETVYVKADTFGFDAGVFTGSSIGSLTRIPPDPSSGNQFTAVHAQAGKTYSIVVASGENGENYHPFDLELTTARPPVE